MPSRHVPSAAARQDTGPAGATSRSSGVSSVRPRGATVGSALVVVLLTFFVSYSLFPSAPSHQPTTAARIVPTPFSISPVGGHVQSLLAAADASRPAAGHTTPAAVSDRARGDDSATVRLSSTQSQDSGPQAALPSQLSSDGFISAPSSKPVSLKQSGSAVADSLRMFSDLERVREEARTLQLDTAMIKPAGRTDLSPPPPPTAADKSAVASSKASVASMGEQQPPVATGTASPPGAARQAEIQTYPVGGAALTQLLDAVRRSGNAANTTQVAPQATAAAEPAAVATAWELADRLVQTVAVTAGELEALRMVQNLTSIQGANASSTPPPPVRIFPPPPPPSPPPPPPCIGNREYCLQQLVASVPMIDPTTGELVTPSKLHMPPADEDSGTVAHWDEMGTVWACRGPGCGALPEAGATGRKAPPDLLASMWDAWEPKQKREVLLDRCTYDEGFRGAVSQQCAEAKAAADSEQKALDAASAAIVPKLIEEGSRSQAEELQAAEFIDHVIKTNTIVNHGFRCWAKCGNHGGACTWCGTNLCCSFRHRDPGCDGVGGSDTHRCTRVPSVNNASARAELSAALAREEIMARVLPLHPLLAAQEEKIVGQRAAGAKPARIQARTDTEWWRSAGKLEPFHAGDLEEEGSLEKAVRNRAWRRELVLTYTNAAGTAWVSNLVLALRAVGIDHSLVVSTSAEHCKALFNSHHRVSCGHTSWYFEGCEPRELRKLWYLRHHYMVRLIALGVNTLMLDGDMTVQVSPYDTLKSLPLGRHNLLFSLDHKPACDDVNIGFMYCQNCSAGGRAQWVIAEALRRERCFCDPALAEAKWGENGSFWAPTDQAGITSGPHKLKGLATAQDQKVISDTLGSSCCGHMTYRKLFPATFKTVKKEDFERIHSSKNCATMIKDDDADSGITTYFRDLRLYDGAPELSEAPAQEQRAPPPETVASVPPELLSSWHGTGFQERAGWSGWWLDDPPMIAHFVGGDVSGAKVNLMQALGWWWYDADEVVAHVRSAIELDIDPADRKIAGALPGPVLQQNCRAPGAQAHCWSRWAQTPPGSSHASQMQGGVLQPKPTATGSGAAGTVRLIALTGPGATPVHDTSVAFLEADLRARTRLAALGALLGRISARPWVHCDSPWPVLQRKGFRGIWQTPGERWPFVGVGIAIGRCGGQSVAGAAREEGDTDDDGAGQYCCSAIYGKRFLRNQVDCIGSVHPGYLEEQRRALMAANQTAHVVKLSSLPTGSDGSLFAPAVRKQLEAGDAGRSSILLIHVEPGESLPPLLAMPPEAQTRAMTLFSGQCKVHSSLFSAPASGHDAASALRASLKLQQQDIEAGAKVLQSRRVGRQLGWIAVGRNELGLSNLTNVEPSIRPHTRAWRASPALSRAYVLAPKRAGGRS